jgi:hypothetical protein
MPRSELVREYEVLTRDYRLAKIVGGLATIGSIVLPVMAFKEGFKGNARIASYPTLAGAAFNLFIAGYYLNASLDLRFDLRRSPAYRQARDEENSISMPQILEINPVLAQETSLSV